MHGETDVKGRASSACQVNEGSERGEMFVQAEEVLLEKVSTKVSVSYCLGRSRRHWRWWRTQNRANCM